MGRPYSECISEGPRPQRQPRAPTCVEKSPYHHFMYLRLDIPEVRSSGTHTAIRAIANYHAQRSRRFERPDYWILAAVGILCLIGVLMVFSSSGVDPTDPPT